MAKYASFENSGPVNPVIGFYDTDMINYGTNLPNVLFEMTDAQWDTRMDGPLAIAVNGSLQALVPYTIPMPEPSLSQQAAAALASGVSIVSTGTPALDGVYAMTPEVRSDITAEVVSLMLNQSFTNGGTVIGIGDIENTLHTFTAAAFPAFATAYGRHVGALRAVQISNDGTLPASTVTIP
jgi:hypothetical protein